MEKEISYEDAIRIGIREGINFIKDQEYKNTTKRYDRRLRNTRLLLRHYRDLKKHGDLADKLDEEIKGENAVDVLDDIESINDIEQYVQALSRTEKRTKAMVKHINKAIKYYNAICKTDGNAKMRRYKIIYYMYIEDTNKISTYEEVAEHFELNVKTVGRDVRLAIEDLSILFFGIDGLNL